MKIQYSIVTSETGCKQKDKRKTDEQISGDTKDIYCPLPYDSIIIIIISKAICCTCLNSAEVSHCEKHKSLFSIVSVFYFPPWLAKENHTAPCIVISLYCLFIMLLLNLYKYNLGGWQFHVVDHTVRLVQIDHGKMKRHGQTKVYASTLSPTDAGVHLQGQQAEHYQMGLPALTKVRGPRTDTVKGFHLIIHTDESILIPKPIVWMFVYRVV